MQKPSDIDQLINKIFEYHSILISRGLSDWRIARRALLRAFKTIVEDYPDQQYYVKSRLANFIMYYDKENIIESVSSETAIFIETLDCKSKLVILKVRMHTRYNINLEVCIKIKNKKSIKSIVEEFSNSGVKLHSSLRPAVGDEIIIGKETTNVVRILENGFAAEFARKIRLDADPRGRIPSLLAGC